MCYKMKRKTTKRRASTQRSKPRTRRKATTRRVSVKSRKATGYKVIFLNGGTTRKATTRRVSVKSKRKPVTRSTRSTRSRPKIRIHQTGTRKSLKMDIRLRAKKPGKRVSSDGNVYYEYRRNRSDLRHKNRGHYIYI